MLKAAIRRFAIISFRHSLSAEHPAGSGYQLPIMEQYMELLGVKVPMNTIPITPGRNLAMILEVAAMNNRQKKLGYNAALEFTEQVNQHFDENMGRNT